MKKLTRADVLGKVKAFVVVICIFACLASSVASINVKAAERKICCTTKEVIRLLDKLADVMDGKYFGNAVKKLVKSSKQLNDAINNNLYDTDSYTADQIRAALGITDCGTYVNPFNNAGGCHAFALFLEKILFGQLSLKSNTNFIVYRGNDLDGLVLQPGDFLRESPWYDSKGKRKEHSAVVWKCAGGSRNSKVEIIESNINSSSKGSNWIDFGSNGFRNSSSMTTSEEICSYIKKHGGFVLRYRYIENDGYNLDDEVVPPVNPPVLYANVTSAPNYIRYKRYFNVGGTIGCETPGDVLTLVHSYIKSIDGTIIYDTTTDAPFSSTLNLRYANTNMNADFNLLPRGSFLYELEAFSSLGGSIHWSTVFTIY